MLFANENSKWTVTLGRVTRGLPPYVCSLLTPIGKDGNTLQGKEDLM